MSGHILSQVVLRDGKLFDTKGTLQSFLLRYISGCMLFQVVLRDGKAIDAEVPDYSDIVPF